jgi:hypothetical protein
MIHNVECALIHAQIIGPAYLKHPFFGLDRAKEWVLPAPFATYKQAMREVFFFFAFSHDFNSHASGTDTRFTRTRTRKISGSLSLYFLPFVAVRS